MTKVFLVLFILSFFVKNICYGLTEAQMKATAKLVRNVCQPKNKATDDQIAGMHAGNWNLDKNGMCYVQCVLNYFKVQAPDNTLDLEVALHVIEVQAPPSIAPQASESITHCKDSVKTPNDKCVAAMEIAKCIYEYNPAKYFLP